MDILDRKVYIENEKVDIDSLSYIASPYYYRMLGTQKKELVESEMKELTAPYQNDKLDLMQRG